ncbi:MAG: hypothetical protein FWF31_08915 [Desulfobulbus sp.]|nr:hypothetical protein [Desulfobulbus sp.]
MVSLANRARVNRDRTSLAYCLTLNVRVPNYEVEKRLWINEHITKGPTCSATRSWGN